MSRQYSDAEKRAYYDKKKGSSGSKKTKRGPGYYAYKTEQNSYKRKALNQNRDPGVIAGISGALGGVAGTMMGGPAGMAIGNFLGGKIGHLVEKITGFGDYQVNSNSLMKGGMSPPQIVNSVTKGGFIIRHREYVGEVIGSSTFRIDKYSLNPGLKNSFPWLSQIAQNFDQYRWRGVIWEFKSTSSDSILSTNSSSSLGSVNFATDYDAADSSYVNKREMLNSLFANSTKPSCDLIHPIECKSDQTPMRLQYVRTGPVPAGTDVRMYDLASTFIAVEGMQNISATQSVGELWVTYEVEFFKQQVGQSSLTDNFKLTQCTNAALLGPADNLHPKDPRSSLGGTINTAGTTYSFPQSAISGYYLFTYFMGGQSSIIQLPVITVANGNLIDIWPGSNLLLMAPANGSTTTTQMFEFVVSVTGPLCTVSFGLTTIPIAPNVGSFLVTYIESTLTDF
jgi:hypothetical protein